MLCLYLHFIHTYITITCFASTYTSCTHTSQSQQQQPLKVVVDGKPLALWRTPTGSVQAISDVCIHRGASLSNGWVQHDRLVCPYHGFEFEGNGNLAYMPGTVTLSTVIFLTVTLSTVTLSTVTLTTVTHFELLFHSKLFKTLIAAPTMN
jgi:nitrite reductase/ring-hydroxylating ferredoxin subunit